MKTTIVIHEDFIDVLMDGYNIIERTVYDDELVARANQLLNELEKVV